MITIEENISNGDFHNIHTYIYIYINIHTYIYIIMYIYIYMSRSCQMISNGIKRMDAVKNNQQQLENQQPFDLLLGHNRHQFSRKMTSTIKTYLVNSFKTSVPSGYPTPNWIYKSLYTHRFSTEINDLEM